MIEGPHALSADAQFSAVRRFIWEIRDACIDIDTVDKGFTCRVKLKTKHRELTTSTTSFVHTTRNMC